MSTTAILFTILGMGLATYGIRLLPLLAFHRLKLPRWAYQAMRYIPAAVLTAIILPELVRPAGPIDLSLTNARLVAGVVAAVVAWRTRNVLATVAVGMGVLWGVQWLIVLLR